MMLKECLRFCRAVFFSSMPDLENRRLRTSNTSFTFMSWTASRTRLWYSMSAISEIVRSLPWFSQDALHARVSGHARQGCSNRQGNWRKNLIQAFLNQNFSVPSHQIPIQKTMCRSTLRKLRSFESQSTQERSVALASTLDMQSPKTQTFSTCMCDVVGFRQSRIAVTVTAVSVLVDTMWRSTTCIFKLKKL